MSRFKLKYFIKNEIAVPLLLTDPLILSHIKVDTLNRKRIILNQMRNLMH